MDFVEHLKRQISYLRRSAALYDSGFHDEAIRMATAIRVIIQQGKGRSPSNSLLTHLNATHIQLRTSTNIDLSEAIAGFTLGEISFEESGPVYKASLEDELTHKLPVDAWWEQIVYVIDGHRLSRKNIVKGAADKDGGAHVDKSLSEDYGELAKDGGIGEFSYSENPDKLSEKISEAHYVAIRQMTHELLNSEELLNLIDEDCQ